MTSFLVLLDVDSTLIDNEVIELIATHAGTFDEVQAITEAAMRGELDFSQSLRQRVATLQGLSLSVFDEVRASVTVTRGVPELIDFVHRNGGKVGVVSGGFHEVLDGLSQELNLDYARANRLAVDHGVLTGKVDGPIIDAQAKADALDEWSVMDGIDIDRTVAIGDGANDLVMMARAGLSIAFCAKPVVREFADVAIDNRDMTAAIPFIAAHLGIDL